MFFVKYIQFILFVLVIFPIDLCHGVVFQIGSLFDRNLKLNQLIMDFAVKKANADTLKYSGIELFYMEPEKIDNVNEFKVAENMCDLLSGGALAVFGPNSPASAAHVSSICDAKEIPYIDVFLNLNLDSDVKSSNINFYPSVDTLSQLLIDVVNASNWQDFVVLYEAPNYIKAIEPLLQQRVNRGIITIQPLEVGTNFRKTLRKIKELGGRSNNIIIECSIEHLQEILEQALQVGLFTSERQFIITNLDAQTIDLEPFQYTEADITLFRIVQPEDSSELQKEFREVLENKKNDCRMYCKPEDLEELTPTIHTTNTALIFDAVMLLAEALKQFESGHIELPEKITNINCFDPESTWKQGLSLLNFMKLTKYDGLSGLVEFDAKGLRSDVVFDILKLKSSGAKVVSHYNKRKIVPENSTEEEGSADDDAPISEMKFKVVIAVAAPYIMEADATGTVLEGNARYEGFGVDIIDALSKMYGFKYEFLLQDDGDYGQEIGKTGNWTGMIGRVMSEEADLAITDLTINSQRISALDFTPSFMNLGIALLYRKPVQEPPKTFSFMSPFSSDVWIYLGISYITVSICFFCLGRISPAQWENRLPCVEEPEYLENQFTLNNSMWFAIGALLQQGSEIEPKAASIRLASSVWWFFTLIMVSSYTANLAAFLVIENKSPKIEGVDSFKECLFSGTECPVQFGAKKNGATLKFFETSTNPLYQLMYKYMTANPDYITESNDAGVKRVYEGKHDYAFLMESSSIWYETERKCNLTQVGDRLDDKNYGIGMRKNFKYQPQMSEGMLRLQENGDLATLTKKWWKERRGGGTCAKKESSDAEELKMANLKGVFWVLLFGCIFAFLYGCIEAAIVMYQRSIKENITWKEVFIDELKFLVRCKGVKDVSERKKSKSDNSGESYRSNQSRYSPVSNNQDNGSNALLNYQ